MVKYAPPLPTYMVVAALALLSLSSSSSFTHAFSFHPTATTTTTYSSPLKHRPSSALQSTPGMTSTSTSSSADTDTDTDNVTSSNTKFWKWKGYDIYTEVRNAGKDSSSPSTNKPAVILLHGFGASTTYWRETMSVLSKEGYDVHALDLLGQGRSSKPVPTKQGVDEDSMISSSSSIYRLYSNVMEDKDDDNDDDTTSSSYVVEMGENTDNKVEYSINLWANIVDDYARHHQLDSVVLMGNSLGSLVALSAATGDFTQSFAYLAGRTNNISNTAGSKEQSRVAGLCLFNCAIGLNSRNVIKNKEFGPIRRALFGSLFDTLNTLIFDNELLLRYVLDNIVTKELLEESLQSLYVHSPSRVDAELVDSFYYPAKSGIDASVEAIRQIYTNDAGLTPMEYHEKYPTLLNALPIHLVWGLEDVVTPIDGDVGTFYCDRVANNRGGKGNTSIDVVTSGHLPFDDNPEKSHEGMMRWLGRKVVK